MVNGYPLTKTIGHIVVNILITTLAGRERLNQHTTSFWAIDSEFMKSGKRAKLEDLHSIQFSNGENHTFIETNGELKEFFRTHQNIKKMYAFNLPCEVGSLCVMLGVRFDEKTNEEGIQITLDHDHGKDFAELTVGKFKCSIWDIKKLSQNLGFRRLSDWGTYLGYPKDDKPAELGHRKWQNDTEREIFVKYALRDAEITARAAEALSERWGIDPEHMASMGTVAKKEFDFPRRFKKKEGKVLVPQVEDQIRKSIFAGRSECFKTGYFSKVYYNDVKSLYPVCMLATRALQIRRAVKCKYEDLDMVGDRNDSYGWVQGLFTTDNDIWGLPHKAQNNVYITGTKYGIFHTYDLLASHAKPIHISRCWKVEFDRDATAHKKLRKMFFDKLDPAIGKTEKTYLKGVMNSASGKLGEGTRYTLGSKTSHLSDTANYLAYHTIVAMGHYIMSKLFDSLDKSEIIYMDTDSVFYNKDITGKYLEFNDGVENIPTELELKAKGELSLFRSKRYILFDGEKSEDDAYYIGRNGWAYPEADLKKIRLGGITMLETRANVKNTRLTRNRIAKEMELGRWTNPIKILKADDLIDLLSADKKRERSEDGKNSYKLVTERRHADSKAWTEEKVTDDLEGYAELESEDDYNDEV